MARPRKEINFVEVDKLCSMMATAEEIAWFFGIGIDTLNTRLQEEYGMGFSEYFKKASSEGKMSLRRKQFEVAIGGNVTMLIWLGKQFLEQSDKQDVRHYQEEEANKLSIEELLAKRAEKKKLELAK